jgi:hypothetical protein
MNFIVIFDITIHIYYGYFQSKNPGPESPALSNPLEGGQAPGIHETSQSVKSALGGLAGYWRA